MKVKNRQIYIYIFLILSILYVEKTDHINWRYSDYSNSLIEKNGRLLSLYRIKHEKDKSNYLNGDDKTNILVIGDSHALDGLNSLKNYKYKNDNVQVKYHFLDDECLSVFLQDRNASQLLKINRPKEYIACTLDADNLKKSALFDSAHIVVYSSEWKYENLKYIKPFFYYLEKMNKKGILLGPNALFSIRPQDMLLRASSRQEVNSHAFKYLKKGVISLDQTMQTIARKNNIVFYSKIQSICYQNQCEVVLKDDMLSFLDHTHWTYVGAVRFGNKIFTTSLDSAINL